MNGLCIELAWNMHGICMDYAWIMHGIFMEYAWNMHGICMDYAWNMHGVMHGLYIYHIKYVTHAHSAESLLPHVMWGSPSQLPRIIAAYPTSLGMMAMRQTRQLFACRRALLKSTMDDGWMDGWGPEWPKCVSGPSAKYPRMGSEGGGQVVR